MWTVIFDKLREKGLNPYPPGKHTGLCEEPFCVVKDGSQVPNIRTSRLGHKIVDIIIFVPISSYIALEPYAKQVRDALKELKYLRKTGGETPAVPDDDKKAYTMSIEYVLQKKLEG